MSVLRLTDEQYTAAQAKAKKQPKRADILPPPVHIPPANVTARRAAKAPVPLECEVLAAILTYLKYHPRVAFAWRANAGVFVVGEEGKERKVRAGFAGQSDILGMLADGRFLAIEVKRPGGQMSQDQHAFLSKVIRHGGVGFMAQSVDDVVRILTNAMPGRDA